ncbi:unnamed protein product, partial [Meganyctiphanes norvegica]
VLLVCLSGLCLSCYAAPFDPVATANNWVGSVSAQGVQTGAALQVPVVVVGTPVVKAVGLTGVVVEAPEPLDAPNPPMPTPDFPFVGGQFHAQDEMGQYAFGHHGGSNTRVETRDYLGRVAGSFSYVNPVGEIHVRKYAAASGMGFKVAASDIPEDTPEVAAVKADHADAIATAKSAATKLPVDTPAVAALKASHAEAVATAKSAVSSS